MTRSRELAELASAYDGGGSLSFRNRIINGDMRIDQRNAGASVTTSTGGNFIADRWKALCNGLATGKFSARQMNGVDSGASNYEANSTPAGFSHSQKVTSLSAYSVASGDYQAWQYYIEGYNVSDLAWGTAAAAPVTLSFWVKSSLTGTFGGAFSNSAQNRSYAFTYTINNANTWEYKTVTVPGDQSGTWVKDNGIGLEIYLGLGVGSSLSGTPGSWAGAAYLSATGATSVVATNGATFYITGVQLEAGSVATPFERRPYGTELALCQRYFQKTPDAYAKGVSGIAYSNNALICGYSLPVQMRADPTFTVSANGSANSVWTLINAVIVSAPPSQAWWDKTGIMGLQPSTTPFSAGQGYSFGFTASAEL